LATPHCDTIEALAQFLNVPTSRTAKAIFYSTGERVIFAVIRGDLQIDEAKVKRALNVSNLRWATDDEIARAGAVPGYASPIGTRGVIIIADDSIAKSPNLVAGANRAGYHLANTNIPRDYSPDVITDIALARPGEPGPDGSPFRLVHGIALGALSAPRALDANYLDVNGKAQKQVAVTLELDLGAILLAHLAAHSDDKGIVWSRSLAPYDAHIVVLNPDKPEVASALEQISDAVTLAGLEALTDDRNESAGIKFNDADLIGLPLRLTIGPRTVAQGGVEWKARTETTARLVPLDALGGQLNEWVGI
jgi:prolyl-tRNA synthetase